MLALLAALVLAPTEPSAPPSGDVFGVWRTQSGARVVAIAPSEDGAPCGIVIEDADGEPPAHAILYGFGRDEREEKGWTGGKVWDAASEKSYPASLRRSGEDALTVTGCRGPLCRDRQWTREGDAPTPAASCALPPAPTDLS